MVSISTRKLTALLNKTTKGRFGEEKAKQLKSIALESSGVSYAKDAFAFQIKQIIEQIVFLENQITDLEKEISSLLQQTNQFITTIAGIGDILGVIILSKIGDYTVLNHPLSLSPLPVLM